MSVHTTHGLVIVCSVICVILFFLVDFHKKMIIMCSIKGTKKMKKQSYKIRIETRFVNGCLCPIFHVFYLSSRGTYEILTTERTLKAANEAIASFELIDNSNDDC